MGVEWTEKLTVGYGLIDEQHRELFRRFNDLLDACQQRQGRERIAELLCFLDDYVIAHFGEEERLMDRHAYAGAAEHRSAHQSFIRKLDDLKRTLQNRGPSLDLVISTNQTLVDWIINHIKSADVLFGAFLKTRAARPA